MYGEPLLVIIVCRHVFNSVLSASYFGTSGYKTPLVVFLSCVLPYIGLYFTFASVQGDFGLFRRIQIEAEAELLRLELQRLTEEHDVMTNRTLRMSDGYLDLDLLDQQARDVLGLVRSDEVVLR